MFIKFNITKDYIVDKPIDDTFSKLNEIISANFYNSQYSTFGNFVSADPPEFLFMAKWAAIGREPFARFSSTKVYATLFKIDGKSKITITTKSNPVVILFLILSLFAVVTKLINYKTQEDLKLSVTYFFVAIGTLLADRFIKNIVIGSFETDMEL